MAIFDQRGQKLTGTQYNTGRDMTINQNQECPFVPETRQALRRYEQGEVIVVPIILRPIYWRNTPLEFYRYYRQTASQ